MNRLTNFTVLIERRALKQAATLLLMLTMVFALLAGQHASAAAGGRVHKVARDLDDAVEAGLTPAQRWSKDVRGLRMVQVVFVSGDADPDMTGLRNDIAASGGTIDAAMSGLRMLTASLPARHLKRIAARSDVKFAAPNRPTKRTASTLEAITGATTSPVRSNSTKTSYSGPDGTAIGIAVVDSGVMKKHEAFNNASGKTRVMKSVQFLTTTQGSWTAGTGIATSLQPGSAALSSYEASIDNSTSLVQDGFGHGTHVASVAAGRPVTYGTAPDLTGVAPNANIYDVKVLNDYGFGTLSDTDRKSTRLNSSHERLSRMPSSA